MKEELHESYYHGTVTTQVTDMMYQTDAELGEYSGNIFLVLNEKHDLFSTG